MTGLIYKELRQNRKALWGIVLCAPLMTLIFVGLCSIPAIAPNMSAQELLADIFGRGGEDGPAISMIHIYCAVVPFVVSGVLALMVCEQDEIKKWGYFTASHPKGIAGALYAKYVLIFLMSLIALVSVTINEEVLILVDHLVFGTKPEEMFSYQTLYILLAFFQLFLRMFDIPFIVRFGKKRGESLKVAIIGGLMIAGFIYLLFGPLPGEDGEFFVQIYDWCAAFVNGKAQEYIYFIFDGFLWATIIGYYLSYKISCKLYLKGVERYDK